MGKDSRTRKSYFVGPRPSSFIFYPYPVEQIERSLMDQILDMEIARSKIKAVQFSETPVSCKNYVHLSRNYLLREKKRY